MDLKFCNASVDFNVPGNPEPLPVILTATVWRQSRSVKSGILFKNVIEFTDPSGTLALPSVPLNIWVQVNKTLGFEAYSTGYEYEGCSDLQDSSVVFRDPQDGDSKLVTVVENDVTLTPVDTSDERFCIYCRNVWYSIPSFFAAILLCAAMRMWFAMSILFAHHVHIPLWHIFVNSLHHICSIAGLCTPK